MSQQTMEQLREVVWKQMNFIGSSDIDALIAAARAEGRSEWAEVQHAAEQQIARLKAEAGWNAALAAELDEVREANRILLSLADAHRCEHCGLPLTCASERADLIHGLQVMHAETLARAEKAEFERDDLRARLLLATTRKDAQKGQP